MYICMRILQLTLVIRLSYEDEWCWRSQVQPSILKCTQLKRLCIEITYLQLKTSSNIVFDSDSEDEETPSRVKDSSHLHALIDGIATQCPSIRVLELFNTIPSTAMDSATYILKKMSQMLEVTLSSYVAPVEANSIPTIYGEPVGICDKKYFMPMFAKDLRRYRYKTRDRKL
ncbi:hypothetical protein BJ165DRAFT_1411104 [Panaeolus papilionaceus]|nr:hypothetical protein BJ165DRAFT_1411104 [Panaeolus papilionaceus]